jgi:DNA-binding GntR family transcriptional regulator
MHATDAAIPLPVPESRLETRTRAEAVAIQIRREILSGELPPGASLRQTEVADRFNVSTTPVREALALLQREGLISHEPHRGAVVFRPSIDDLRENYEIRLALEPLATEIAARSITAAELAGLRGLLEEMRAEPEPHRYYTLNREFHARLYEAARRPTLTDMIDRLRDAATAYMQVLSDHLPDSSVAQEEHEQIVAELEARAPKRAAKAMAAHLSHNERLIEELISADGVGGHKD